MLLILVRCREVKKTKCKTQATWDLWQGKGTEGMGAMGAQQGEGRKQRGKATGWERKQKRSVFYPKYEMRPKYSESQHGPDVTKEPNSLEECAPREA